MVILNFHAEGNPTLRQAGIKRDLNVI